MLVLICALAHHQHRRLHNKDCHVVAPADLTVFVFLIIPSNIFSYYFLILSLPLYI